MDLKAQQPQVFQYSSSPQSFTVPQTGTYRIEARGAQGGGVNQIDSYGGLGASMSGEFLLSQNDVLTIVTGKKGPTEINFGAQGGGGSYVTLNGNPLVVAGGGGGGAIYFSPFYNSTFFDVGKNALTSINGGDGASSNSTHGTGGTNGSAGGDGFYGSKGGQGWSSCIGGNGVDYNYPPGDNSWGGAGGGGGGYSGGVAGGNGSKWFGGGGGGSLNTGSNQVNSSGVHNGNGLVTITFLHSLISGNVKDIAVSATGVYSYTNIFNCEVKLYQNGTLLSTKTTDTNGDFSFTGLTGTTYSVVFKYGATPITVTYNNINKGQSLGVLMPHTLLVQVNALLDSIDSKIFNSTMFYGTPVTSSSIGYNINSLQNLVDNWNTLDESELNDVTESLGRTLIALKALHSLSNDAASMIAETIVSTFDLLYITYSCVTLSNKIDKILKTKELGYFINPYLLSIYNELQHAISYAGTYWLREGVLYGISFIDDEQLKVQTKANIKSLLDAIADKGKAEDPDDFIATLVLNTVKEFAVQHGCPPLYKNIYVDLLTQSNLDNVHALAAAHSFSGDFEQTYDDIFTETNNSSYLTLEAQIKTEHVRNISEFSGFASEMATKAAILSAGMDVGVFLEIAFIFKTVSLMAAAKALKLPVARTSKIIDLVPVCTDGAFSRLKSNITNLPEANFLSSSINDFTIAKDNYNAQLSLLVNEAANGTKTQAIAQIQTLIAADSALQAALIDVMGPIKLAAPYISTTIADFDSLYGFPLFDQILMNTNKRQAVNFTLVAYMLDSINTTNVIDSLVSLVPIVKSDNDLLESDFINVYSLISSIPVPANVTITNMIYPKPMQPVSTYPITIQYKNYGSSTANQVFAKIVLPQGFTTPQDSVYLSNNIIPGSAGSFTFNVTTPIYDTLSSFTVIIQSSNADGDGTGGSLVIRDSMATGIENIFKENQFTVYPNPFNNNCNINYQLIKSGEVSLSVYNLFGQKISDLVSGYQSLGEYNVIWNSTKSIPNGVYFLKLIIDGNISTRMVHLQR